MQGTSAVISCARGDDSAVRGLEEALVERLSGEFGMDVLVVPDLYDLTDGHAALEAVRSVGGPMAVLAWMYPRATRWLLARPDLPATSAQSGVERPPADVQGRGQSLSPSGRPTGYGGAEGRGISDHTGPDPHPHSLPGREREFVVPVDLRAACCVDAILDRIRAAGVTLAPAGRPGAVQRFDGPVAERWYPVIDYDRCADCLECLEFCLFGVYDEHAGRPVVARPERCKPGCPACARVCPQGAIIFPRHQGTPAIAGADEGAIEPLSAATVQRDGIAKLCADAAAEYTAVKQGAPCACRPGEVCEHADPAECAAECGPECDCHSADPLDRAIDELDADENAQ